MGTEGELQLSQFELQRTQFRALNYTRGETLGSYSVLQVPNHRDVLWDAANGQTDRQTYNHVYKD